MIQNRDDIKKFRLVIWYVMLLKKHIGKVLLLSFIALLSLNIPEYNIRDKLHNISVSIYSVASYPIYWTQNRYNELKDYVVMFTSAKDVYLENQRLKAKLQDLELIMTENNDLKQLVNFHDNFIFSKVTGRVVLESHENFRHYYLLNIGTENGIQRGNAIVTKNRLIGRVIDVNSKFSKMQPLTNKGSKIPVSTLIIGGLLLV